MKLRYLTLLLLFTGIVPASAYTYELNWSYMNQGTEPYDLSLKDLGVPVFPDTGYQTVSMETSYGESELLVLESGYLKMVPLNTVTLQPSETYTVYAVYQIESTPRQAPAIAKKDAESMASIPESLQEYTAGNALYPVDNTEISTLAEELTSEEDTVLGKVLDLLDWFDLYSIYTVTELPRRPEYTIRDPRGDCDDLALLFITMCRSQGIPAYLQAGLVLSESVVIDENDWDGHYRYVFDGAGWHAWAMVYIPPWGWLPVDLTKVSGVDLSMAITEAYYWRESTIISWNITNHDYVSDEISQRDAFLNSDIYYTQTDTMIVEEKEEKPYLMYGFVLAVAVLYYMIRIRTFAEA